jgi:hypothetical protein
MVSLGADVRHHARDQMSLFRAGWVFFGLLLCAMASGAAQDPAESPDADPSARPAGDWLLEHVTLLDGKTYDGLVASEGPAVIEFVEVHRPRGKPMFLVVRPIYRKAIKSWVRLTPEEQEVLRGRLEKYKQRALIEGRRMEDLTLSETRENGVLLWNYRGRDFTLESTADEPMTRRVIVRLGQIFTAYRQLLPPRQAAQDRVHIRVFGASDQYRVALGEFGLPIRNPAVYLPEDNLILAGSDLNRFSAELAQVNREHRQIKQQFDAQMAEAPARLKHLGDDLKANGVPTASRLRIVLAEQKKWDDQRRGLQRKIAALDRKNAAKFNEVGGQMFRRLAHEAFHAYLETQVYPRQAHDVPRWLNEGLAQTFEAGLLEADTLRIDTPNLVALASLQNDLQGPRPLELAEVLNAGSQTFLAAHAGDGQSASRLYYYSWGLAYYLAFDQGVFGTPRFDAYLSPAAGVSAVERFETLVGMPLDAFQTQWREAMLALKPST